MIRTFVVPRHTLPLVFTAIAMTVFFLVMWTFPTVAPNSRTMLTSELLKTYDWVGSFDQRIAHLLTLITIIILSAIAFVANQRGIVHETARQVLPPLRLWMCAIAAIGILVIFKFIVQKPQFDSAYRITAAFFLFVLFAPYLTRNIVRNVALIAIGAYLSFIIIPGFFSRPIPFIAPSGDVLAQVELHINSLLSPGVGLSAGQSFFRELPYNYGLLMPSIMSIIDHRYGALSISDQLRFVQYCQVLFTLLAAAAYLLFRPRNYLGVLVALALAAPFWSSSHMAIWHPNQSGFRSLTLPLGCLGLILIAKYRPRGSNWLFGLLGGTMVLINQETAIAMGASFLVFVGLRERKLPVVPGLKMAAAAVFTILGYLVVYRLMLGRLPFSGDVHGIFETFLAHTTGSFGDRLFAAGSLNENYYIVPFALVIFAHTTYVLINAIYRVGRKPLSTHEALRGALSATTIIWLSYYFNFPNWWQIWTHLFLYGFLIVDMFDVRLFALAMARRPKSGVGVLRNYRMRLSHVAPLLLLPLMIPRTNGQLVQYTSEIFSPPWINEPHQAAPVSGLLLPADMAAELKSKSDTLLTLYKANNGRVIYLTYNVAFIPTMSRIFEPVPERNLFSNVEGDADFDPVMNKIFAKEPAIILIDMPTGPLAVSKSRKDFQDKVRDAVAKHYRLDRTEGGWQVWTKARS